MSRRNDATNGAATPLQLALFAQEFSDVIEFR